jgi:glutaminyl-peptide cyclotransferase
LQLDLLGHKHAHVTWQFENTRPVFARLQAAERHLRATGKLKGNDGSQYLSDGGGRASRARGAIQDDHLPFLKRNVPVVHLIASPFPTFWHTAEDTLDVVDGLVMRDLSLIFCVFVAELYLA